MFACNASTLCVIYGKMSIQCNIKSVLPLGIMFSIKEWIYFPEFYRDRQKNHGEKKYETR